MPRTRKTEASDPSTSPARLSELAKLGCSREVAGNPNTPVALLLKLAARQFDAFLANPILPLLLLEDPGFCAKIPASSLRRLLRSEALPEHFLQTLARHPDPEITAGVRLHVRTAPQDTSSILRQCIGAAKTPVDPLPELFDHSAVPVWLTEPLAGGTNAELRDFCVAALEASADPEQQKLGALFRRAGAALPQKGKPARPDRTIPADEMARLAEGGTWARHLAARHPNTPPEVLRRLASSREPAIRRAVLRHPHIPEEPLWLASSAREKSTRLAVARNISTPVGIIERLASDPEAEVRAAVLSHWKIPASLLPTFVADPDDTIRLAIARNPHTDAATLAKLAADPVLKVRIAVAENRFTSLETITAFVGDPSREIRAAVAQRRDLPLDLLALLMVDKDDHVSFRAKYNSANPHDLISELLPLRTIEDIRQVLARWPRPPRKSPQPGAPKRPAVRFFLPARKWSDKKPGDDWLMVDHHSIALDRTTSTEDLDRLARTTKRWTLEAVGGNPNTRPATLTALLHHPNRTWRLYYQVAGNPSTPLETLESLSQQNSRDCKYWVASNPNCPVSILARFAADPAPEVRQFIAYNPRTPLETLIALRDDPDPSVRRSLLSNPAPDWDFFAPLLPALENAPDLRCRIARNPKLSAEWRARLVRDPIVAVRMDFAENPALTVEEFHILAADPEPSVRATILNSPQRWPAAIFEERAASSDLATLAPLASHQKCPEHVLATLATHPDPTIRDAVANNPNTPAAVLATLATLTADPNDTIFASILRHPRCPEAAIQRALAAGPLKDAALYGLLAIPTITEDHYRQIIQTADSKTRQRILHYEKTPIPILTEILALEGPGAGGMLNRKRRLPPEFYESIVTSTDGAGRHALVNSFHTPWEVIARIALNGKLSDFYERRTRASVARNPDAPADFLIALLEREKEYIAGYRRWSRYEDEYHVLIELIRRPELPIAHLQHLTTNPDRRVRRALLARADTPQDWRDTMRRICIAAATRKGGFARLSALAHRDCPPEELHRFAKTGRWLERYSVAKNPACPEDLRQALKTDANTAVRQAAEHTF